MKIKDEQIEEMANDYYEAMLKARETLGSMNEGAPKWYAKELNAKGYRKASEVVEEIFAEIEQKMNAVYNSVQYGCYFYMRYGSIGLDSTDAIRQVGKLEGVKHLGDAIAELKKKYTEEEK